MNMALEMRCFTCLASTVPHRPRDSHDRYYKLSVHPVEGGDAREVSPHCMTMEIAELTAEKIAQAQHKVHGR